MNEKAKYYYSIIHSFDVLKVLRQIEVSAKDNRPVELCELSQDEYNSLIFLLKKYLKMIETII